MEGRRLGEAGRRIGGRVEREGREIGRRKK